MTLVCTWMDVSLAFFKVKKCCQIAIMLPKPCEICVVCSLSKISAGFLDTLVWTNCGSDTLPIISLNAISTQVCHALTTLWLSEPTGQLSVPLTIFHTPNFPLHSCRNGQILLESTGMRLDSTGIELDSTGMRYIKYNSLYIYRYIIANIYLNYIAIIDKSGGLHLKLEYIHNIITLLNIILV